MKEMNGEEQVIWENREGETLTLFSNETWSREGLPCSEMEAIDFAGESDVVWIRNTEVFLRLLEHYPRVEPSIL